MTAAPTQQKQSIFAPDLMRNAARASFTKLSPRELETLEWIAKGLNNNEIAERMSVSHGSVKAYVSHLCEKLAVRDRVQVLISGIQWGLVHPELDDERYSRLS